MLTPDIKTRKKPAKHRQEKSKKPAFAALTVVLAAFLITGFSFAFSDSPISFPNASQELAEARQENVEQRVSRSLERGTLFSSPIFIPEDTEYVPDVNLEAKVIPPKNKSTAVSDFVAEQEREEAEEAAAQAAAEAEAAEEERVRQEAAEEQALEASSATTSEAPAPQQQPQSVPASTSQEIAHSMVMNKGWSEGEFTCLVNLWQRESNWNHLAQNPSSGAYGIPQSLPGSKMASHGSDWQTNPATQISWGIDYIARRYGTPCAAWQHSENHNWY